MIPLTSSLYVEAELDSSASVLVEIGTGYYAEARVIEHSSSGAMRGVLSAAVRVQKSVPDGADYFKRKVTMVKGQLDKIGQVRAAEALCCTEQRTRLSSSARAQALQEKQRMHEQVVRLLRLRAQESQK